MCYVHTVNRAAHHDVVKKLINWCALFDLPLTLNFLKITEDAKYEKNTKNNCMKQKRDHTIKNISKIIKGFNVTASNEGLGFTFAIFIILFMVHHIL